MRILDVPDKLDHFIMFRLLNLLFSECSNWRMERRAGKCRSEKEVCHSERNVTKSYGDKLPASKILTVEFRQ